VKKVRKVKRKKKKKVEVEVEELIEHTEAPELEPEVV
jgi:nicotinate-nucleotide pyrophosphorylase